MHYYIEYGGGLGDVFHQMIHRGRWNVLRDLGPDDTAEVVLITHNPCVKELFEYHPKRDQIRVRDLGYWLCEEDAAKRKEHNLPPPGANAQLPEKDETLSFYTSATEMGLVHKTSCDMRPYIVVSANAGLPDRDIPFEIVRDVIHETLHTFGFKFVFVGKNFDRHGRAEYDYIGFEKAYPGQCVSMVDKLSVPATANILRGAAGLVTCHSALNILGWLGNIPQLLLYPESVRQRHFLTRDQWSFGKDRENTVHGLFTQYDVDMLRRFWKVVAERIQKTESRIQNG